MKQTVFALIDCNNFFVSCEKIFRPELEGRPVVVLSSNDGCVVSRSNEAKALGIPMGAPAFKYRQVFKSNGVVQFSGNFDLYGDISRRITQLLASITPRIEVYSVDESFLDLSELGIKNYEEWGKTVAAQVLGWVGVPISIGIASTKTLAKIGTELAKKRHAKGGAVDLINCPEEDLKMYLAGTKVEDVWGIGRRLAPRLRAAGLSSANDVARLPTQVARALFGSVHGKQVVMELCGTSCFGLEQIGTLRKSIARTRTFGEDTGDALALEAAIAGFAGAATHKLRLERQLTRRASLFITTNRHKPNYKSASREVRFMVPTADTGTITSALVTALGQIIQKNVIYHRAGVLLYDFIPANSVQTDLLGNLDVNLHDRSMARMEVLDAINNRFGKNHIRYAAEDLDNIWEPKKHLRSPCYTSDWNELPVAKIRE